MLYLDWNATMPVRAEVWEAMRPWAVERFGNAASSHSAGRAARRALEDSRERIAQLLDARPDEVIFTSGATEANNLAVFGLAGVTGHVLASPVEHPAVAEPIRQLAKRGFEVDYLPVDANGQVDVDAFRARVRPETWLAAIQLVNHETGTIQPIAELAGLCPLHVDAAQGVGKIPVSFRELRTTSLAISGHKFGGPKGIGALVLRHGTRLEPQLFGGHQQHGRRPGTEPVDLAVGLATALELATGELREVGERLRLTGRQFVGQLRESCPPIVVNSPMNASPYVVNISFPGCRADLLLVKLDLAGIACSTGSACSSGSLLPSPVLQAMGVSDDVLRSAMRFSFGRDTTAELLGEAASRIVASVNRLRAGVG